ncbi:MAG: outer membrane protein assembly factor BamB [Gammaproteobacteria bacterium]|nr:outer membrane protein assembly factor BamB [Gammaproteobacteria bacterium]
MLNRVLILVIIGASLLQQACTDKDNSEPPAPLTKIDAPLYLVVDWRTDTGAGIENASYNMQPLLIQDQIFSIDTEGEVQSINAKNGRVTWYAFTRLQAITGLSGQDGVLIASSRNGDLNAYDILENNLRQRWSIRLNGEIRAVPVISDAQVFVRTVDGKLSALSMLDGSIQWTISRRVPALSLTGNSRPLVQGDLVIAGFDDGKITAFSRSDGQTVWNTTVSNPAGRTEIERLVDLDGQFILKDGIIYISSYQGRLAAIQAIDGNVLWSRKFSSYQSIVADEEALYLSNDSSHIWSIDRRTGSAFWKQEVLHARKITAPLLIDNNMLVVADLEGYVHWFDKSDGSLLGRVRPSEARHIAQPLVWQDRVLVIDSEGMLSSLGIYTP